MRYSLRSLMIAMIVVGVVCGRVAHLKRWKEYHDREAERLVAEFLADSSWDREYLNEIIELKKNAPNRTMYWDIAHHRQLANEYWVAMYRPWTIVKERGFPNDPYIEWKKHRQSIRK